MRFAIEEALVTLEERTVTDPFIGLRWTIAHVETEGWRKWRQEAMQSGGIKRLSTAAIMAGVLAESSSATGKRGRRRTEAMADRLLEEATADADLLGRLSDADEERVAIATHLVRDVGPLEVLEDDGTRHTVECTVEAVTKLLALPHLLPLDKVREGLPFRPDPAVDDEDDLDDARRRHDMFTGSIKTVGRALTAWVLRVAEDTQAYMDRVAEGLEGE